jgi:hypothetical protein
MFPLSAMSEFKFACPVCGQHMSCDSSHAGTVMECPTCFQKITVPQAPATTDPKFILTGTKVGDRPVPKISDAASITTAPAKGFPVGALVFILLICAAGAAVFAYRGKVFKFAKTEIKQVENGSDADQSSATGPTNQAPPRPALAAPPANDTNWMLNLDAAVVPDTRAAGRIDGQDFIVERAVLQNGTLTLREGRSGPLDFAFQVNFSGAQPEALAGQTINIATNALMAARVSMFWSDDGLVVRRTLEGGYAMRLNFGAIASNRISGGIYFCAPDEKKSYLAGTFNAEIRKSRPRRRN